MFKFILKLCTMKASNSYSNIVLYVPRLTSKFQVSTSVGSKLSQFHPSVAKKPSFAPQKIKGLNFDAHRRGSHNDFVSFWPY